MVVSGKRLLNRAYFTSVCEPGNIEKPRVGAVTFPPEGGEDSEEKSGHAGLPRGRDKTHILKAE